jgi:hypothetical protein
MCDLGVEPVFPTPCFGDRLDFGYGLVVLYYRQCVEFGWVRICVY